MARKKRHIPVDGEILPFVEGEVVADSGDEDVPFDEPVRKTRLGSRPMPLKNLYSRWQGRTPDVWKIYRPEEEKFYRVKDGEPRFTKGLRKRKITVPEPLLGILDKVMDREAVSEGRIENFFGLPEETMRRLRQSERAWVGLKLVRQILWALGYDISIKLVKVAQPYRRLVLSEQGFWTGNREEILGNHLKPSDWDGKELWDAIAKVQEKGLTKTSECDEVEKMDEESFQNMLIDLEEIENE